MKDQIATHEMQDTKLQQTVARKMEILF